jgi:uncharacterized protein YndB with AHSA1/START domain
MTEGMRRTIRWILVLVSALVGIILLAGGVGLVLPSDHVARMSMDLRATPDQVWELVSDVAGTARWRPEVEGVDVVETTEDGRAARFIERSSYGETPFTVVSRTATSQQVVRVEDDGLPFGGTWTWELAPSGSGTRLTITEDGFVRNPIFRVMSRLFFPPTATMDAYLRALAAALGETAEPRVLQAR